MILDIKENGQYKNIDLKQYEKKLNEEKERFDKIFALDGKSITVTKKNDLGLRKFTSKDGRRSWSSAICFVDYEGEEVSFFLKEKEYDAYSVLGTEGSVIKISGVKKEFNDNEYLALSFELVE